jgi:cytochrome c peroxidase
MRGFIAQLAGMINTLRGRLFVLIALVPAYIVFISPAKERQMQRRVPALALPASAPAPAGNPITPEKVELGKQLFFDARLSGDGATSCGTCHLPEKAFADGLARARGAKGRLLSRNTPSLLNVGFYSSYFWDGRAASLEEQALVPIQSAEEMHHDMAELEKGLNAIPGYARQFQSVFGGPATKESIARALAAFQRTLVSRNSPFDRYLAGNEDAISEDAKQGWELFRGGAGCARCHNGPTFSDGRFHRLGTSLTDKGRGAITGNERDTYAFRTPGLRDVARTAPYLHDGSIQTLTGVVEFYYRTAPIVSADGRSLDIAPLLDRSYSEISPIVAFLESLNGESPQIRRPEPVQNPDAR